MSLDTCDQYLAAKLLNLLISFQFKNFDCKRLTADALNKKHLTLKEEILKQVENSIKDIAGGSPKMWLQCVEDYLQVL